MNEVEGLSGEVIRLSEAAEEKVAELKKRYPSQRSAVMPALYLAQEELGWLTPAAINWVADRLEMPLSHVREVATFYTMYYKGPVGKYHIQICRTLSCAVCGKEALKSYLETRLGLKTGQVSADGMWSFEEVECLGSCGTAPMVQINDYFFEKLTPEKLGEMLDRIEQEKPSLRYSTVTGALGSGLAGRPKSEVWG